MFRNWSPLGCGFDSTPTPPPRTSADPHTLQPAGRCPRTRYAKCRVQEATFTHERDVRASDTDGRRRDARYHRCLSRTPGDTPVAVIV